MERFVAEFFGTMVLVLLGDGVVAGVLLTKSKAQNSGWVVITLAWAMAVFCGSIVSGPMGGTLNPAFTLANAIHGATPWDQVPIYVAAEMLGALVGAGIVGVYYWDHFKATEDPGLKLAVFSTGPNIRNYTLNFVCEAIATFVLVFVAYAMSQPHSAAPAALGAVPVAMLILALGMSLGGTTGYALNPARDLSPRIAHFLLPIPRKGDSDWGYSWVPVLGPVVGAVAATFVYDAAFTNFVVKAIG